jgi:hypothetical protein
MTVARHLSGSLAFAVAGLLLLAAPNCQYPSKSNTGIEMDGNNPPTFVFSGKDPASAVVVTDVSANGLSRYAPERVMWEIVPAVETSPSDFPRITYGIVPLGFVQRTPATGPARRLDDEKPYRVTAPTSNTKSGKLLFIIRNGQALRLDMADDEEWYVQTPTPND